MKRTKPNGKPRKRQKIETVDKSSPLFDELIAELPKCAPYYENFIRAELQMPANSTPADLITRVISEWHTARIFAKPGRLYSDVVPLLPYFRSLVQGSNPWLLARRFFIGASSLAKFFGEHARDKPPVSADDAIRQARGEQMPEQFSAIGKVAMAHGKFFEDLPRNMFVEKFIPPGFDEEGICRVVKEMGFDVLPQCPYFHQSTDGNIVCVSEDESAKPYVEGILEIKCHYLMNQPYFFTPDIYIWQVIIGILLWAMSPKSPPYCYFISFVYRPNAHVASPEDDRRVDFVPDARHFQICVEKVTLIGNPRPFIDKLHSIMNAIFAPESAKHFTQVLPNPELDGVLIKRDAALWSSGPGKFDIADSPVAVNWIKKALKLDVSRKL